MRTVEADVRRDYAVFSADRFVTNALLTSSEVERMERDGYRCVFSDDTAEFLVPAFRGRRNVKWPTQDSRKWDR